MSVEPDYLVAGGEIEFTLMSPSNVEHRPDCRTGLLKQVSSCSDTFYYRRRGFGMTPLKEVAGGVPRSDPCLPGAHGSPRSDWEVFANLARLQDYQAIFASIFSF